MGTRKGGLMIEDEVLTKEELAKLFKVNRRTIDRMRDEGMPYFKIGSNVRFFREKVVQWFEEKFKD